MTVKIESLPDTKVLKSEVIEAILARRSRNQKDAAGSRQ